MVSMQEYLLQRKLDKELPERVAERELQVAEARRFEDIRDILAIKSWHTSTIRQRMVAWQNKYLQPAKGSPRVCPFEGEVLFCDGRLKEEQDLLRIVDTKESLMKAWYGETQGLTDVFFRSNRKGTLRYIGFGFYSADVEAKFLSRYLNGRLDFDGQVRASLNILRARAQLPVNVLKVVKQFLPEYVEHLEQEKERVETKAPRW